jgi:hypothetical protein
MPPSSSKKMKKSAPETPTQEDKPIVSKTRASAKKLTPKPSKTLKTPTKSPKGTPKASKTLTPKGTPKASKMLTPSATKAPSSRKSEKKNKKVVEELLVEEEDDASDTSDAITSPPASPTTEMVEEATERVEKEKKAQAPPKPPPSMDINVHRIRHLDYHPKPILCIRATPQAGPASNSCVAISRDNGRVELKGVSQKFRTIATIAGYREKQVNVGLVFLCGWTNGCASRWRTWFDSMDGLV